MDLVLLIHYELSREKNGTYQMSCTEITWLYVSWFLFLTVKMFLSKKQITAERVKVSRNGKCSNALDWSE